MHGSHAAAGFAAYDTMRRAEAYSRHPLEAQDSLVLHNSLAASPASVALEHQVITIIQFLINVNSILHRSLISKIYILSINH